ncbi:MAG TPA: ethanolamine utilization protein, partial [Clostridiales bacterium]|nr:ethanolamine utilization protein [Clostridiales bacterium]
MNKSIGGIELRSISKGIEVTDFMVKKAQVEIIYFRSICPGKFIALVSGNEGEVKVAIDYGVDLGQKYVVDSFVVNNVHEEIIS